MEKKQNPLAMLATDYWLLSFREEKENQQRPHAEDKTEHSPQVLRIPVVASDQPTHDAVDKVDEGSGGQQNRKGKAVCQKTQPGQVSKNDFDIHDSFHSLPGSAISGSGERVKLPCCMKEEKPLFTKLYEAGEESFSRFAKEVLAHPAFATALEKALRNATATKGKIDRNMDTVLGVLNLPSKADYTRLLAKIETVQGSLVNLNIKLDRMLAAQAKTPTPVRSRNTHGQAPSSGRARRKETTEDESV